MIEQSLCSSGLGCLQEDYLRALVAGSGRAADRVVEAALDLEITPQHIYLDIFQPTAYAIGRLWQSNRISVAGEHLATAIIERQMGELHPLFKPVRERKRIFVLGCVPDEWHRVGARMVADFFEAEGWQVHYLGANVPIAELVGIARETSADLVGLSAEMLFNLTRVAELVRALDKAGLGGIPVIAGGMPFIEQPGLAPALNLRGSADSAGTAVALADVILGGAPPPPLPGAEAAAAAAIAASRTQIIAAATASRLAVGDSDPQIGPGYAYCLKMLEAALVAGSPALLDGQISWANERQPHDGVAPEQILARLQTLAATMRTLLPDEPGLLAEAFVNHMVRRQQALG